MYCKSQGKTRKDAFNGGNNKPVVEMKWSHKKVNLKKKEEKEQMIPIGNIQQEIIFKTNYISIITLNVTT